MLKGTEWEREDRLVVAYGVSGADIAQMQPRVEAFMKWLIKLRRAMTRQKKDVAIWMLGTLANDGKYRANSPADIATELEKKKPDLLKLVNTLEKFTCARKKINIIPIYVVHGTYQVRKRIGEV